jgi:PAS domain-containing protein
MSETLQSQTRDVILDSIVDGVFTVDENWRIISFNRAAETITGVPSEDAIGQRCCDVFHASICEDECALREGVRTAEPVLCRGGLIEPRHLPAPLRSRSQLEPSSSRGEITLKSLKKMHITEAIRRHGGNRKAAGRG